MKNKIIDHSNAKIGDHFYDIENDEFCVKLEDESFLGCTQAEALILSNLIEIKRLVKQIKASK